MSGAYVCNLDDLKQFVVHAKPKDMFKYFTGTYIQESNLSKIVGNFAYDQAVRGQIYLVQKRRKDYSSYFDYYAIKASPTPAFYLVPLPKGKFVETHRKPKFRIKRRYVVGAKEHGQAVEQV